MPSLRDRVAGRLVGSNLLSAEKGREGDRVTTLELFFDLVYVFAFTQVSYLMSHGDGAIGVLQGLVTLALLWWSWTSYAWLANQAHADRGVVRSAVIFAIAGMFLVSLVIPEAYHDFEGGLYGPVVFVVAYFLVRIVHMIAYVIAAGSDAGLRRQVLLSMVSALVPASALLLIGAMVGEPYQVWIWLVAIALDLIVVYLTSRGGSWRVHSVAHFSERHSLVVILALGESVVAIGVGSADLPIDTPIIIGAVLAVALCVALWWNYFSSLSTKAEHLVTRQLGVARAQIATDAYTYLHFTIVAGIIVTALGIEKAMEHIAEPEALGLFAAAALGGGVALYIAGTALFWRRVSGQWAVLRFAVATVSLLLIPIFAIVPPITALAIAAALVIALGIAEASFVRRTAAAAA